MKALLSEKGKDFKDKKLNENNCIGYAVYKNRIYSIGNRYQDRLELYIGGNFIRTISMNKVRLIGLNNGR